MPHSLGCVVSQADGHATAEGMADDQRRALQADGVEEGIHPGGVALEVPAGGGQVGGAAETGQRRRVHAAAPLHQLAEHVLVGAVAQPPPVQEHDRQSVAADGAGRGAPVDLQPPPPEVVPGAERRLRHHHCPASLLEGMPLR